MVDFKYYTPTEVVFGKDAESHIAEMIHKYGGTRVLVHYGGGSAVRSGLVGQVEAQLDAAGIPWIELGGVVPNPRLSLAYEGIARCRREKVDFLLAIGGGSAIDSAKVIAYGLQYDGDVWDIYCGKHTPVASTPIGVVLTIPASGSEMSDSAVITRDEGMIKRGCNSDLCRPRFAIMNPERTFTLPPYQTAAGATDIMMHTLERYFSRHEDMTLTDALAEALLRTVMDAALEVLAHPDDYRQRAQIMWAGSLSHNDLMECGTEKDFATHKLEHELSALFGVTHGAGLAALWPSWARYVMDRHLSRFVQFAVNVMGVTNDFTDPRATALKGIAAIERFFSSIGMPVTILELIGRPATDDEIATLVRKCSRNGKMNIGALEVLTPSDMEQIYRMANQ